MFREGRVFREGGCLGRGGCSGRRERLRKEACSGREGVQGGAYICTMLQLALHCH